MASPALAQQPALVKDINTQTVGARSLNPQHLTDRNGTLYFVGNSDAQGRELWKSNGTTAGTTLVKDITPGPGSSDITGLTLLDGTLYFAVAGELWKSDGTAAGTVRVLDLYANAAVNPTQPVVVNGALYFSASSGTNRDLWRSDGTAAGTTVIKSFPAGEEPLTLVSAGGALYFSAQGSNGYELWKSNGTATGTVLIDSFQVLFIEDLRVVNGTAYFPAYGSEGIELFKSNGTAAGTVMVKDIYPGSQPSEWGTPVQYYNSSVPRELTNVNGTLFFVASDANGRAVWKSNGTAAGTVRVSAYYPTEPYSYSPSGLANVNGTLYFGALGDLYKSSGTLAGTIRVKDIGTDGVNPANFTVANGTIFFTAASATSGNELWKTNGTATGTTLVRDIAPGAGGSAPAFLKNVNGTLFLSASNGTSGPELWKSDGTSASTLLVRELTGTITGDSDPARFFNANGTLYFSAGTEATGYELWKSDGTAAGTVMVKDIYPGDGSSAPSSFVLNNGLVYFAADNGVNGTELWKTDGTAAGTVMVKDIRPGGAPSLDNYQGSLFVSINNVLYFPAYNGPDANGAELWKSDGTAAGTVLVKDIVPGNVGSSPWSLTNVNGTLYFAAHNGVDANGFELWKSNGTAAGTVRVKSIASPTGLQHLVNFNNTLYFTADKALWKSNGTDAGTTLVKTLNTVGYTRPYALLAASGKLWIVEDQGAGWTLWKSDGTAAGTLSLKSFPNNNGAPGARVFNLDGTLYFNGSTGPGGIELWKSDGTVAGTVLVKDLDSGIGSSQPDNFAAVNGTLYFSANDYVAGERRLWKSNGTAAGTVTAANYPAAVANLFPVNGTLFFTGNDGKTGNELWKLTPTAPAVAGTIRVNAGGIAFATLDGRNFVADAYFSGGTVSAASTAGIAGTADDYLYQTGRHGSSFAYNFPTGNGSYDVVLHFAETYFGAAAPGGAGSRKFHVNIEGARKLTDYDVFARAGGALRVAQETFRVTVGDGTLNVAFLKGLANNPAVKAIEVLPAGAALTVNAGGSAFTTGAGKKFSADSYYAGGTVSSIAGGEIANTTDDALYRNARVGVFSYGLPSGNGTFNVTLHFAETYFGSRTTGGVGSRKFNVYLENVKRLSDYDVFAKAGGAMRAVKETIQVTVTDGVLNLYFAKGLADNPLVSAIEVTPATTAAREGSAEAGAEAVAVKLFPNPVQDRLYVALPFPAAGVRSTAVTDNAGRVHLLDAHRANGENGLEIPAAGLREGFYLLRLDGPQGTQVVKFLKQ